MQGTDILNGSLRRMRPLFGPWFRICLLHLRIGLLSTFIICPFLAMLPRRWRARILPTEPAEFARAGVISGVIEAVLGLFALVVWYSIFVGMARQAISHSANSGGGSSFIGVFALIWFWINPITWCVAYFGAEGAVRSVSALANGDVYGMLPLYLLDRLLHRGQAAIEPEEDVIADEVLPGNRTCDMRIASCRAKADWEYPFTIKYEGTYFQVMSCQRLHGGLRPFVYSLRRLPAGERTSGLREYHLEDILAGK